MSNSLRNLGYYKALCAAATQFNSIIFRIVVGFLANIPSEVIALICFLEFGLNLFMEVPMGFIADKYGKAQSAICGHFLIILALISGYIGILISISGEDNYYIFFILHGSLLGFGKPLISGSVESFYQSILSKVSSSNLEISQSMTLSSRYGKVFTLLSVLFAFGLVFALKDFEASHHSFIIGIVLWVITTYKLILDYKNSKNLILQDNEQYTVSQAISDKGKFISYVFCYGLTFLALGLIAGYLPVAIGRSSSEYRWEILLLFYISSQGLGTYLRGVILPFLVSKFCSSVVIVLLAISLIISSIMLILANIFIESVVAKLVMNSMFALIMFIGLTGIMSLVTNKVLSLVHSRNSSVALSIMSMPGYLFVAFISYVFYAYHGGSPNLDLVSELYFIFSVMITVCFSLLWKVYK